MLKTKLLHFNAAAFVPLFLGELPANFLTQTALLQQELRCSSKSLCPRLRLHKNLAQHSGAKEGKKKLRQKGFKRLKRTTSRAFLQAKTKKCLTYIDCGHKKVPSARDEASLTTTATASSMQTHYYNLLLPSFILQFFFASTTYIRNQACGMARQADRKKAAFPDSLSLS